MTDWSDFFNLPDVGAAMPESYGAKAPIMDPLVNAATSLATLPKRAIDAATQDVQQRGSYGPERQGMAGPALEAAMLPMGTGAIAGLPMQAGEMALGAGPIRAYHGSPHDFDRFDISKIGSGEGAQAYGHGLYFAGSEDVAKHYRDALSSPFNIDAGDLERFSGVAPFTTEHMQAIRNAAADTSRSPADAAKTIQWRIPELRDARGASGSGPNHDMLTQAVDYTRQRGKGRMYEVGINADPEQMLDWDKPFSAQSPYVQDRLRTAYRENWPGRVDVSSKPGDGAGLYQGAAGPQRNRAEGYPNASQALSEAGIPGLKYLDEGSRALNVQMLRPKDTVHGQWLVKQIPNGEVYYSGPNEAAARAALAAAPKPTHNYVTFGDNLIDILRKYGWAGVAALPALQQQDERL